ncbi:MAG: hypothetical protein Q7S22_07020 [Candidatus Micrarchaeota archaeon]|nr:hypothetical protein [Candidatus Micrarchaeota archaeon]
MAETVFTLRLHGESAEILEKILKKGYSESKTEVMRTALLFYASKLGLISRKKLHKDVIEEIRKSGKTYTPEQVMKQLEELES